MDKKPKYFMAEAFGRPGYWVIQQVANNVVVGEFSNQVFAELFLEWLNSLPTRRQPRLRKPAIYPHLRKKQGSDNH